MPPCIQFHVVMRVEIVTALLKAKTEEEILKNAAEHAVKEHGYKEQDIMTPEMKNKIISLIRKS